MGQTRDLSEVLKSCCVKVMIACIMVPEIEEQVK